MSFGGGSGSSSISGSTDVVLNSPADNDVLGYNTGLAKWQNRDLSSTYGRVDAGSFNLKTHSALAGDGTTDDTTALQAAINAMCATGANGLTGNSGYLPPGEYVISNTINIDRFAGLISGAGIGNSPAGQPRAGNATVIRWNGSAGVPMFKVTDSDGCRFANIRFEGKDTALASYAVEFLSDTATDDSGYNHRAANFDHCYFGKYVYSSQGINKGSLACGIGFTGTNGNNDMMTIANCYFRSCLTTGLYIPNSQSVWGETRNTLFDTCGIGIQTAANHTIFNVSFNACTKDVEISSTAVLKAFGWNSENSGLIFDVLTGGGLNVKGALWTIASPMSSSAYFAQAIGLQQNLSVEDARVVYQITPIPLKVRGTYSTTPYNVRIKGCLGLSIALLDIQGYGAPDYMFLDIDTQGISLHRNILTEPLTPPVQTKTGSYTMTTADQRIITNGASVTITLPDPTTISAWMPFAVKNINSAAATVNSAGTSKTIDGTATQSLAQWAKATYVSNGTNWLAI